MTSAVLERADVTDRGPLWQLAVASFLPPERRLDSRRWIARLPLALILLIQTWLTLRLSNTAFRDEGLYIWTGHHVIQHWYHGAVLYDQPENYFSGSPYLYPVLAAMLDYVHGLELVRAFSLVCMLSATVSLFCFTRRLFHRRVALAAAISFALAGPTQHLGNFATFDAMTLSLLAAACAVGVRAAQRQQLAYAPAVAGLLTLAVCTKYAALLFVPIVLGLIFLSAPRRLFPARVAISSFLLFAGAMLLLVRTIGRPEYTGFRATTTERKAISPASALDVAGQAFGTSGAWYVLAALGLVLAALQLRRYWVPLVLAAGTIAPVAYQAKIGELVSLDKHQDFGLVFAAPLIGVALAAATRVWSKLLTVAWIAVLAITGAASSQQLFHDWSDMSALTDTLAYSFRAAPYIHTLGEPYEPVRYAFHDSTQYWQWDTTDPIVALYYQPPGGSPALRGMTAAKAGLAADYWQVVYFNGSTGASRELEPLLPGYGYKMTDTVTLFNDRGPDVYHIWQRFK